MLICNNAFANKMFYILPFMFKQAKWVDVDFSRNSNLMVKCFYSVNEKVLIRVSGLLEDWRRKCPILPFYQYFVLSGCVRHHNYLYTEYNFFI